MIQNLRECNLYKKLLVFVALQPLQWRIQEIGKGLLNSCLLYQISYTNGVTFETTETPLDPQL